MLKNPVEFQGQCSAKQSATQTVPCVLDTSIHPARTNRQRPLASARQTDALASATLLNSEENYCLQSPFAMGPSLLHVLPQQSFLQQTSSFFLSSHITKVL